MPPINETARNDIWQVDDLMRRGIQVLFTATEDSLLDDRRKMYRRDLLVILDAYAREDFDVDNAEFTTALRLLYASAGLANQRRAVRLLEEAKRADAAVFDVVAAPASTYPPTGDSDVNPFIKTLPRDHEVGKLPPLALDETQRAENLPQGDFDPFSNKYTNHAAPEQALKDWSDGNGPEPGTDEWEDLKK